MIKNIIINIRKVENGFQIRVSRFRFGWKGLIGKTKRYVAENPESLKRLLEQILGEFEKEAEK